jgi:peptide/nickel transport system substrate-binding protein
MYHMIGFTRVGPRIDFVPDVTTNSEIHVHDIHFVKASQPK